MRIIIDANVLISAFFLPPSFLLRIIESIAEHHAIVLPAYALDELNRAAKRKFPEKYGLWNRSCESCRLSLSILRKNLQIRIP
ncbi:MAG: hypothetical protein LBU32_31075 [Clostridiales bacterium]|jgi:predicted nucleic acid-binding protein|nr:hypothetical protein [Clostridiales bacterium]